MRLSDEQWRERLARYSFGTATPEFWAMVVDRQLARIETTQDEFARIIEAALNERTDIPVINGMDARLWYPAQWRLDAPALVSAIDKIFVLANAINGLARDPQLGQALYDAREEMEIAGLFRDMIEHLDRYAVGKGCKPLPDPSERGGLDVQYAREEDWRGELVLGFGGYRLPLKATSERAIELARVASEVSWRALTRGS